MQVILLEDVKNLGKKDEVVKVSDGYARNFILPKKLGVEATDKNLKELDVRKAQEAQRQKEIYDSQTGSAQPHIYPQHIAVMPVIELDSNNISSFTEQVAPFFRMIGTNNEENKRLASIRDTLLPRLMSGELDVSRLNL